MILQNAYKNFIRIFYKMSYLSYTAINQNADKKDESYEKIVIAKIGAPAVFFYGVPVSAVHGEVSTEIVGVDV